MHRPTAVTGMLFAMTANLAASFIGLFRLLLWRWIAGPVQRFSLHYYRG